MRGPIATSQGELGDARGATIDSQSLGVDRLVEPRVGRPTLHVQHQHAATAGPGNIVFELRAIAAQELVRLFDDDEPLAAEHGHSGQFLDHVAEFRRGTFETRQREIALVALEHGMTNAQQHLSAKEQFVAKHHADRLGRMFVGLLQIVDCGQFSHAASIPEKAIACHTIK